LHARKGDIVKEVVKYIPGFRSGATWKKTVASIYYAYAMLVGFQKGFGSFLSQIGLFLFICFMADLVVYKKKNIPTIIAIVIAAALISTGDSLLSKSDEGKALEYLSQAEICIAEGKIDEALDAIAHSKQLNTDRNQNEAFLLDEKLQLLNSDRFMKQTLVGLSDDDVEFLRTGELNALFIDHEKLNAMFLKKLAENVANRPEYLAEIEEQRILAEKRAERKRLEERKEKIEKQFSAWDGSHINLTKVIKKAMNDPKSYDHVETVYWDMGDHLVVRTTFRGKNVFGGVVKNTVKAKVSDNGDVLEIIEQY
jgi:hypothetical protein